MGITVLDLDLISTDNINKCRQMCTEAEIILTVREVKSNINSLIALNLLEEQLLISDLYTLIAACSDSGVSLVDTAELDNMSVQVDIFSFHVSEVETWAEIIVGIILLSSLNTVLTSVIDRRDTWHSILKSIDEWEISGIVNGTSDTVNVVIINEVIEVDILVDTAVHT
jgi:hypothetical protein